MAVPKKTEERMSGALRSCPCFRSTNVSISASSLIKSHAARVVGPVLGLMVFFTVSAAPGQVPAQEHAITGQRSGGLSDRAISFDGATRPIPGVGIMVAGSGCAWTEAFSSALTGLDGNVYASAVFNDGSGPALYAGGQFTMAGGVSANGIAKWDGTS